MKYFAPSVNIAILIYLYFSISVPLPAALIAVALLVHASLLGQEQRPSSPSIDIERIEKLEKQVRGIAASKLVK